jgi:hypothetical protein
MDVRGGNESLSGLVPMPGLDVWVYSRPYGDADSGGDIYYLSACATGRISRILIADVSGHGSSVSAIAMDLRALMGRFVNYLDPRQLFSQVNARFAQVAKLGTFATAVVVTFFSPTRDLTLCNAGHPPPLLFRCGSGQWLQLDHDPSAPASADNLPLGVVESVTYDQLGLQLEVGDLLLCFSDSLTEARGGDGRQLGQRGLLELVQQLDPARPDQLIEQLLVRIATVSGQPLDDDDVTVLLLRPTGAHTQPSFVTRLLAPLRVLGQALGLTRRNIPVAWPEISVPNLLGPLAGRFNRVWTCRNAAMTHACRPQEPASKG